jgi:hypothetical protein
MKIVEESSMDSNLIKEAVNKANKIIASRDRGFETNECRSLATNLILHLTTHFDRAPATAAAVIQYLSDNGFKITNLKGDAYFRFMRMFGPRISQFSTEEVEQLRKIAKKLMLN